MDIYERKLMLVDDNQELLEMIADILRHSGYKNIVKAWNFIADEYNQWDTLSEEEKIELYFLQSKV